MKKNAKKAEARSKQIAAAALELFLEHYATQQSELKQLQTSLLGISEQNQAF